jgi:hypothetical protein
VRETESLGLAVRQFYNALKSGIDAKSLVIPGEDPAELEALAENYHRQFQPASPVEICLLDALITADWELRRLRKILPKVWDEDAFLRPDSKEARRLDRLNRRLDAAERSYHRALKELNKYAAARAALQQQSAEEQTAQTQPAAIEAAASQKLASFLEYTCPPPDGLVAPAVSAAGVSPSTPSAADRPNPTQNDPGSESIE